jgi:hypothetical protein
MHQTLLETNELIFLFYWASYYQHFFKNGGTKYQTLITYITLQQALLHFFGFYVAKICLHNS